MLLPTVLLNFQVMRPHGAIPGITYRFLEQAPLFEFGFGLSYTKFSFGWARSSNQHIIETQAVQVRSLVSLNDC